MSLIHARTLFRHCLVLLAALAVAWTWAATAHNAPSIPPGFLAYPPYNGFVFEAVHLLPKPHDHFIVDEVDDYTLSRGMDTVRLAEATSFDGEAGAARQVDKERDREVRLTAVPASLATEFQAVQAAPDGDAAYAIGKDLPEAIRLYTAAAVDFRVAHPSVIERQPDQVWSTSSPLAPIDSRQRVALDKAIPRFQAVLDLADAARPPRAVAAAYMLGRSYALRGNPGDAALAEKAFMLTRTLARAGLPDPQGLAVASFGDQARLRREEGDLASAIDLYAKQAAHESVEGVESLKCVAQALYEDSQGMAKVEDMPLGQRLLIAYALEFNDDGRVHEYVYTPGGHPAAHVDDGTMDLLVRTAKQWPKGKIAWPDRMAALAYRTGDFNFAQTLIHGRDTALAGWLRAKMEVASGKLVEAEATYKHVVTMLPAVPNLDGLSSFNASALCSEMAQLERTRGEFIPAIRDQLACDRRGVGVVGSPLVTYLAERVLTTRELRDIVAKQPLASPSRIRRVIDTDSLVLRSILAKRLVREGRYKEAVSYANTTMDVRVGKADPSFDTGLSASLKTQRDLIQAYASAKNHSGHAATAVARASAWYQLALLTRIDYHEIAGHDSGVYHDEVKPPFPGVSPSEIERLKTNHKTPDKDDLHWYLAYGDALKAAQLVPARSQAYAAILCHAAHWMYQAPPVEGRKPEEIFASTYRLYLKNGAYIPWGKTFGRVCPDPDFKAASRPAWRRELDIWRARILQHPVVACTMLVLAGLLLVAAGWFLARRSRASAPA